jgi:hypothetical protein
MQIKGPKIINRMKIIGKVGEPASSSQYIHIAIAAKSNHTNIKNILFSSYNVIILIILKIFAICLL